MSFIVPLDRIPPTIGFYVSGFISLMLAEFRVVQYSDLWYYSDVVLQQLNNGKRRRYDEITITKG